MTVLDPRSEAFLADVHPDLAKIMRAASQEPQPFQIVYGIRTLVEEAEAVATGHSTTMHSRHLPNKDGLSCAVDVAALIGGKLSFAPGKERAVFGQITDQIKRASSQCLIPIECGIDWVKFPDFGHVQLPWHQYP